MAGDNMNPVLNFLRSPRGRALTQQAITAAGEHLLEAITNAGTAGALDRRRGLHGFRVTFDHESTLKEAEVLDVRVGDMYTSPPYNPAHDPDAP